jgi:RNA polymerase sigma factor (sigma-70 family)
VSGKAGERLATVEPQERFTALYQARYAAVLRYASRRTDPDTARDVAADTFLVAWRRLADLPARPAEVEPWLYGVARLSLANAQRSLRRAGRVAAQLAHERRTAAPEPDHAEAVTAEADLEQALRQLPERDQETLRLIGWEGLDLAGAALAMGCSRATMAVRVHRARLRLASAMSAVGRAQCPAGVAARPRMQAIVKRETR